MTRFEIREVEAIEATGSSARYAALGLGFGSVWGGVLLLGAALAC